MTEIPRRTFLKQAGLASGAFVAGSAEVILAADHAVSTRVGQFHGVPTFQADGADVLRPGFETYVPERKYFKQFAESGTRLFMFSTNAQACDYGHSRATAMDATGSDFAQFEQRADAILQARPDAWILPRINLGTARWWLEAHPEAWERFADGSVRPRQPSSTLPKDRPFPSLASPLWRQAIADRLASLITWIQASRFGPHIFGYQLSGLHTEEWYHWSSNTTQPAGYSKPTVTAFRQWLRQHYGKVEHLRSAWNNERITFEDAPVPSREDRFHTGDGTFRDAQAHRPVVDFLQFWNELIPDTIDYFASVARKASQGKKVIGAFYAYGYEFAGNPEFGHNAFRHFLTRPNIDFVAVTASYFNRQSGTGGDYARSPALSARLHGKVWYHGNDVVSFLARNKLEAAGLRPDAKDWTRNLDLQLKSLGYTDTPWKSRMMYRRGLGFALCHGMFTSWFDLHGGYFDHPALMQEIGHLGSVASRAASLDRSSVAQILVVSDERSSAWCSPRSALLRETFLTPQNQFIRIGAPVDHVLLQDLDRLDTRPYKLVIFLNAFHLSPSQRDLIGRKLKGHGRHLAWCYYPDRFGDARALTGFDLQYIPETNHIAPVITLRTAAFGLNRQFLRRGWKWLKLDPASDLDWKNEPIYCRGVRIRNLEEVDALGDLTVRPDVAFARRSFRDWTSLYLPTARLAASAWRELARVAGVHLFSELDDVLYANQSLLCLHASHDGMRQIRFPVGTRVTDAHSGSRLDLDQSSLQLWLDRGETRLFYWEGNSG